MKNIVVITLIFYLNILSLKGQYQSIVIQTPTGVSVNALRFTGTDFTDPDIAYWNWYWTNGYNCRILANSTNYYNCHGYAWYDIEGRMGQADLLWINDVNQGGNPIYNVTKYYSGANRSYVQVTTVTNHLRVSYFPRDHSAVTTENQDSVISKFAFGPLVKHTLAQCPFYSGAQIKYYKLHPLINGYSVALCSGQETTYSSSVSIPGSTYTWSKTDALLDYVSGAGTSSYTVRGKSGSGAATVNYQITTPSGEIASPPLPDYIWVGPPIVSYISGPTSYNPYCFYAMPTPDYGSGVSYTWSLYPSGSLYYWMDHADVTVYDPGYYVLSTQATNSCGSTSLVYTYFYHGGYFMLSPNPASDEVTVTIATSLSALNDAIITNESISSIDINELVTYSVKIYNNQGTLVSKVTRSGKSFNFPIHNLQNGLYIVELNDGKNSYREQLIIKH